MKMTIHQGLSELKLLDNRIKRGINQSFIGIKQNKADKVDRTNLTKEEFEKDAKANFDSVSALIARRQSIKNAITTSNAVTKVSIASKEMTVATAIELKQTIDYKKQLVVELKRQYNSKISLFEDKNESAEYKIQNEINALKTDDKEAIKVYRDSIEQKYTWDLIDPLVLKEKIEKITEEIENFESTVDFILSTSNATTIIEIDD